MLYKIVKDWTNLASVNIWIKDVIDWFSIKICWCFFTLILIRRALDFHLAQVCVSIVALFAFQSIPPKTLQICLPSTCSGEQLTSILPEFVAQLWCFSSFATHLGSSLASTISSSNDHHHLDIFLSLFFCPLCNLVFLVFFYFGLLS